MLCRVVFVLLKSSQVKYNTFDLCSDASFGYPGGPILFKNLNFGIDLDSRIASMVSLFSSLYVD